MASVNTKKKVKKSIRKFSDGRNTTEYECWKNMIRRCKDPKISNYKNYGGRGIKVCKRWLESFENFYEDMGDRPSDSHSLERIDVNLGYEPANCKWGSWVNQCRNRTKRFDNTTGVTGVKYDKVGDRYIAYINVNKKQLTFSFSCNKFGHQQAKLHAIAKRNYLLKLHNYGKNHGQ